MYAVIKTGGKQYKVAAGEKIKVEQIPADIGAEITLDQVLAVGEGESIQFGAPLVSGRFRQGYRRVPRSSREGHDLQDASPEALPEARRAIARTTPNCESTRSTRLIAKRSRS